MKEIVDVLKLEIISYQGKEKRMRKLSKILLLLAVLILMVIAAAEIYAAQTEAKTEITIRELESQTVLYTIYRGQYQNIGQPIGNLYGLAMKNQIWPRGSLSLVYLNNPQYVSGEHCLVEIRIPVDKDALKKAGTLGEMTDIKELKAMEVAAMTKSAGQMDHNAVYNKLYTWISQNGYMAADNACEIFENTMGATDYSQMKTEIMIPVGKISSEN